MFLTDSLLGNFISVVIALLVIFITYFKWKYQYWAKRGVPYLDPRIPYGNFESVIKGKEHFAVYLKEMYDEMKSKGWKYGGMYLFIKETFIPIDLELVRSIMAKDFHYFADRGLYHNEKEPLQAHLVNLTGAKWKNLRAKLTPTFTSGKIKMMFNVMTECQSDLQKRIERECLKKEPIDIKEILACFTTNIIGSVAFGLDVKALENDDSQFRKMGKLIFHPSKWMRFKQTFATTFPKIAKMLDVRMTRKEVVDFMSNMVQETIEYREKNNYARNDFLQLLINLKNNAPTDAGDHDNKPLSLDEVASQALIFYAAGFETSSTLMTFALYELGKHQEIQDKVRNEINMVLARHDNQITYDSIQDMPYLSQVIDETLRLHPPAGLLGRKCVKDYKIPNTDVIIEKGTNVMISVHGIHYDEEFYPNPTKFDPERFTEENKKSRHHFAYLPFGEGPRNCIGMRFGLLQSKMGLVALLQHYRFTVNKKTKEPIVYHPGSIILVVEGEVWLDAERVSAPSPSS